MPQKPVANFTCVINLDDHDDEEIKRAVLPRTAKKYERSLKIFNKFLELHPAACSPPDIKTFKGFLEFYVRNTPGQIEEKPTPETVENFRRDFETALARSVYYQISKYIISDLKTKLGLPDAEMSRDGLSPNDLTILLTQLWCRDFKEYRGQYPDRSRVQLTASILLYCFSSARTGEVHESTARRSIARQKDGGDDNDANLRASAMAACYKHFILTIELVDGIPMLVLTYAREFVKGYWRMKKWEPPVHAFYEVYKEEVPLFFNLIFFMLPLFSADHAFCHYKSYTEILDEVDSIKLSNLESQRNHVISRIYFRKDLLDTPVFRPFSELNYETSTGRARGADAFGKEFAALGYRSGYEQNVTAQFAFLSAQLAMADSPETAHEIHLQRRRVQSQKDKLYLEELKWQREVQQGTQTGSVYEQTLFHYRRRAMPERDLLAQILPTKSTIRSPAGQDAMKALEAICSQYHPVTYRSGLRPVNGKCICGESVDTGYTKNITARACRRWALMEADKKYSETARMKHAGQVHRDTYGKSYAHPLSEVDGPATFLGIASHHEHIQNRRSMGIHRNPYLWQLLPAKAEFEFQERSDVMALDKEVQSLSTRLSLAESRHDKQQIQLEQHWVYNRKQQLYAEELRHLQQVQPRTADGSIHEQSLFHYVRRVIPKRDLLARILPTGVDIRSITGWAALRALEAICLRKGTDTYRSGISPLEGKCLCGKLTETFIAHRRWSHLYNYYKKRLQEMSGHRHAWVAKVARILPLSALIDFIDIPEKLHIFQLTGAVPLWSWPITLSGSRLLLSDQHTEHECYLDRYGSSMAFLALDGRYGDNYTVSSPETVRQCLSTQTPRIICNLHANMSGTDLRIQNLEFVHIVRLGDKESPRRSNSWLSHIFISHGAATLLRLLRSSPRNWSRDIPLVWVPTQTIASQDRSMYNRLVLVTEHMNSTKWTVFYGESTIVNSLLNRPLEPDGPEPSPFLVLCLFMALRILILGQWAIVIGATALKGWDAYFTTFWIAFCIFSHAYLIPPRTIVKGWMRSNAGFRINRFSTRLSSRRALLNTIVALNPDTFCWLPKEDREDRTKFDRGGMKWVDPILAQGPSRSEWEEATREAITEAAERYPNDETLVMQMCHDKEGNSLSSAWNLTYPTERKNYWKPFILEGIYMAAKLRLEAKAPGRKLPVKI
ncbi:uncharacterized protein CDV56_107336 [Aspergillus thermomutatus]|uniref:Uncharacterized protein n=1 Tax=Aspergillus thermomutatus TaxID=41047 RepID=A0A397HHQ3_ASPTH|nr:uncharacterized protein CDV56_107336 [Aspergillus thermomutatus]RHZ62459.1 hypothetical protein CDV56_107336 [Aspergillus thermomutatus]